MGLRVKAQTYTGAQTSATLIDVAPKGRLCLEGVIFTAHADNTVNPAMSVSVGGSKVIEHPGVPAGGGLVATNLDIVANQGDDVTFDCEDPGGSVSVSVIYGIS